MQHIQCKFEAGGLFYMHIPNSNPVTSKACINRGGRGRIRGWGGGVDEGTFTPKIPAMTHQQSNFNYSDIGIYIGKLKLQRINVVKKIIITKKKTQNCQTLLLI